nr:MAG TPA: hypothetical protein [Caudoviricetes sp.]
MILNMLINKVPGELTPGCFYMAIKSFHVAGPQIPSTSRTFFLDS